MYTAAIILLLIISLSLIIIGGTKKKKGWIVSGIILIIFSVLFFWFMGFWGEKLWFGSLNYTGRFWKVWITKTLLFAVLFVIGGLITYLLTGGIPRERRLLRYIAVLFGALVSGFWWYSEWEIWLKFSNRVTTDVVDPVLGMQTGFYLFTYPLLKIAYRYLLFLAIVAAATCILGNIQAEVDTGRSVINTRIKAFNSLFINFGIILIILAIGKYLDRFGLMYSRFGYVTGPGWTDVHIRLPLLTTVSYLTAIAGIVFFIPGIRNGIHFFLWPRKKESAVNAIVSIPVAVAVIWFVLLGIIPVLIQWLKVEPNEITLEHPYIKNNIRFTRIGFHLDEVEEREFQVTDSISQQMFIENKNLFSNIRLWDYRALDDVFKQFQEIRLYYEFHDVDIDRYRFDSLYREVMISAREIQPSNLPAGSQTFVNKRFQYTHGFGAVMTPVNKFTPQGLPDFLIEDIPPVSKYPALQITRPEIYYGELSGRYVIVNSKQKEFDYPSGSNNVYTHYQGDGGVRLSNLWRKIIYGWKFGGTRLLLSGYPTKDSRIMIHRKITERVETLAPFLFYDQDPYVIVAGGKLYWIIDAYTTSKYFPYSEPYISTGKISYSHNTGAQNLYTLESSNLQGKNYLRNAVKVVIDAYSGKTDFYIFDKNDPLIKTYDKMFPGLLKQKAQMPEDIKVHTRYPADMLLVQGLIYAKYHMTDPDVFYNQEDLWVQSTENYYDKVQPVEPYYIMWELPGSYSMEFVLILPFSPKGKQVMIGWIAGMCDDGDYGRFLAYQFPKDKRIVGTQQVETKIDQDPYLSEQLTLWDQRGSKVIRGNVLAIPMDKTLLYVEPIFLRSVTSAFPELRLVVVMQDDNLSYATSFDQALQNLLAESNQGTEIVSSGLPETPSGTNNTRKLILQANSAFENYLDFMQKKQFDKAADALKELQQSLEQLAQNNNSVNEEPNP